VDKCESLGHGKNRSVAQSTGDLLVFLDADDIMRPGRVAAQAALAAVNPTAIVGGCWRRYPAGSTEHYETWANTLEAWPYTRPLFDII
jgi:hypothetical protein